MVNPLPPWSVLAGACGLLSPGWSVLAGAPGSRTQGHAGAVAGVECSSRGTRGAPAGVECPSQLGPGMTDTLSTGRRTRCPRQRRSLQLRAGASPSPPSVQEDRIRGRLAGPGSGKQEDRIVRSRHSSVGFQDDSW